MVVLRCKYIDFQVYKVIMCVSIRKKYKYAYINIAVLISAC